MNWEMISAIVGIIGVIIAVFFGRHELWHFIEDLLARKPKVPESLGAERSRMEEAGFNKIEPVDYREYYSKEQFLQAPSQQGLIYHVELFRNAEGLDKDKFKFVHHGSFHLSHPIYAELEGRVADKLDTNETRLRVAKIGLSEVPLKIHCQKATYSQVLVTNHSDELAFRGQSLRDVFAPSIDGKLPSLEDSLAANPAGCNCLLETDDNFLIIQRRSSKVETNKFQHTPSVSGGTEYSRHYPPGKLDPFYQLGYEMWEEISLGGDLLVCHPMLLAISRDVQRNGLPEFFFYARLRLSYEQVQEEVKKHRGPHFWEHRGIFPLRAEESEVIRYIVDKQSSLALKANLTYYFDLLDVVREWCDKQR